MAPLKRRIILLGIGGAIPPAGTGCVTGNGQSGNNDGAGSDEDHGDLPTGTSAVSYEDLSDRGQELVDTTYAGGHSVTWIHSGNEKVYVRYDEEAERWVQTDDPLSPRSVEEELQEVYYGGAYLEMDGQYYETVRSHADGWEYRVRLAAVAADECDGTVTTDDLSGFQHELAATLLDDGEAWVAEVEWERFADADVYYTETDGFGEFLQRFDTPDGACLKEGDRAIHADWRGGDPARDQSWRLEVVREFG